MLQELECHSRHFIARDQFLHLENRSHSLAALCPGKRVFFIEDLKGSPGTVSKLCMFFCNSSSANSYGLSSEGNMSALRGFLLGSALVELCLERTASPKAGRPVLHSYQVRPRQPTRPDLSQTSKGPEEFLRSMHTLVSKGSPQCASSSFLVWRCPLRLQALQPSAEMTGTHSSASRSSTRSIHSPFPRRRS